MAAQCNDPQIAALLIAYGADFNAKFGQSGHSPLSWAVTCNARECARSLGGSRTIVELLEQSGADAGARDDTLGCTPRSFGICVPANWGFAFLVRARLAEDPTLVNIMDGRTSPLHEATRSNELEVVRLLLDQGADPLLANGEGKTALDVAMELGHVAAAEMLRSASGVGNR